MNNREKHMLEDDDLELVAGGTGMTGSDKLVGGTNSDDAQQNRRCQVCTSLKKLTETNTGYICEKCESTYDKNYRLLQKYNSDMDTATGMMGGMNSGLWA